jgi:hypothetical protein
MKRLILLAALALPSAVLAQTGRPTPEQLQTLQLRLNEQQQQLNQLRLRQPTVPPQDLQMRSLQNQLDQQQIELQRLRQQQESCPRGRC